MGYSKPISDIRVFGSSDNIRPDNNATSEMEISDTSGKAVSDYMGYGSFSGADTKVVVHIPKSQVVSKKLQSDIEDIKSRITESELVRNRINSDIAKNLNLNTLIQQKDKEEQRIILLNEELQNAEEAYKSFLDIPTTKTLGEIQTVSWSIHRDKAPVRTLGKTYASSYVRNTRSIAGSMVFAVFYQHALHELLFNNFKYYSTGTIDFDKSQYTSTLLDQLPPLDISLVFANEYGAVSHMGLYGVEFFQEGATHSVEDIYTENTVSYVARDLDPMRLVQTAKRENYNLTNEWTTTATQLKADKEDEFGHLKRRNPFI